MEDQEAEQEEESAEECYYVQPSDQQILACLPPELKVLPEHSESAPARRSSIRVQSERSNIITFIFGSMHQGEI